jgi:hypothetical protein
MCKCSRIIEISTYLDYYYKNFVVYAMSVPELAVETGQDLKKITFKDQSWQGLKTRSRKFNM